MQENSYCYTSTVTLYWQIEALMKNTARASLSLWQQHIDTHLCVTDVCFLPAAGTSEQGGCGCVTWSMVDKNVVNVIGSVHHQQLSEKLREFQFGKRMLALGEKKKERKKALWTRAIRSSNRYHDNGRVEPESATLLGGVLVIVIIGTTALAV